MSGETPPENPGGPPPLPQGPPPNPYAPPEADLTKPANAFESAGPGGRMSFSKRLLVLPVWFVVGLIPLALLTGLFPSIKVGLGVGEWLFPFLFLGGLIATAYAIYVWMVVPFGWVRAQRLQRAWLGVPAVILTWGAFLFALLFAFCGLTGTNFH